MRGFARAAGRRLACIVRPHHAHMETPQFKERSYPSGAPPMRTEMVGSKPHGKQQIWNEAGVLILEANYRDGELHGTYNSWWDDGALKESGEYRAGNRIGKYRWYKPSGELWSEHTYDNAA